MSFKAPHATYKGVELPIHSREYTNVTTTLLLPLAGPPVSYGDSDFYGLSIIRFMYSQNSRTVSHEVADYVIQINSRWYLPSSSGLYCHVNVLLARHSKLGRALWLL